MEPPPSVYRDLTHWVSVVEIDSLWTEVQPSPGCWHLNESRLYFQKGGFLVGFWRVGSRIPLLVTTSPMLLREKFMHCHPQWPDTTPSPPQWGYNIRKDKGTCQWTQGLAGWQNDWHACPHCLCGIQYDSVVFAEHWVQVSGSVLMIVTKKKAFVLEMNAVMAGTCESAKLRFIRFGSLLCQDPATPLRDIWQETDGPFWNISLDLWDKCISFF